MLDAYETRLNTMQNYQELAQRTSATPTPELIARLSAPKVLYMLDQILFEVSRNAYMMDALKKHIFYGKEQNIATPHEMTMTPEQIQLLVNENGRRIKVIHGIIGLITEAGELADTIRGFIGQGEDFDFTNIAEEAGDNQWYMAELLTGAETTFERVQKMNIAKLAARYGDKFSEVAALVRDLNKERGVLESEYKDKNEIKETPAS